MKSLNNDEFDDIKLENLAASINNYLTELKNLYKLNIITKQDFLIHYPYIIKKFGPPLYYNTMRFEAKNIAILCLFTNQSIIILI